MGPKYESSKDQFQFLAYPKPKLTLRNSTLSAFIRVAKPNDIGEYYRIDLCSGGRTRELCHTLLNPKNGIYGTLNDKTFLTNAFYGFESAGTWHLVVKNVDGNEGNNDSSWSRTCFCRFRTTNFKRPKITRIALSSTIFGRSQSRQHDITYLKYSRVLVVRFLV